MPSIVAGALLGYRAARISVVKNTRGLNFFRLHMPVVLAITESSLIIVLGVELMTFGFMRSIISCTRRVAGCRFFIVQAW